MGSRSRLRWGQARVARCTAGLAGADRGDTDLAGTYTVQQTKSGTCREYIIMVCHNVLGANYEKIIEIIVTAFQKTFIKSLNYTTKMRVDDSVIMSNN